MSNQDGFKLIKFHKLTDWKILDVDESVPMVSNPLCPADDETLKTICTLVGGEGAQKIRIGFCENCGYVGYIDRPTKEWIYNFYFSDWDRAEDKDTDEIAEKMRERFSCFGPAKKGGLWRLEALDKKYNFDKNKFVLDLGSGYGKQLKIFEALGFKKLAGVENSVHRAEATKKAYGFKIFTSPFEVRSTQKELKKLGPIGLIHSHHVLEHTYKPSEIIQAAASLQKPGEYFLLALPNIAGEVSLSVLLFFPHLHSFSPTAIESLMNKHRYEVIDNTFTTNEENYILAKKSANILPKKTKSENIKTQLVSKFRKGLALKEYNFDPRLFWCNRGNKRSKEASGQVRDGLIARSCFHFKNRKKQILSAAVCDLKKRYTSVEESPFEIQFAGNVKLTYK